MAEPKRVALHSYPVEQSKASAPATITSNSINNTSISTVSSSKSNKKKPEKNKKKEKQIAPSIRFNLNLFESTDEKYPTFNYQDLLKNAQKKRKKDKKKEEKNNTNGTSVHGLFDDTDEDEKVLDVAKYFEEKYGNRKKDDYVDLGAGYDDNDSFIDNTDMYDELVPQEVTTVLGGFYVNSGLLEFKDSDNINELLRRNNLNKNNDNDDEESSDNDSEEDDDVIEVPTSKSRNKRQLSSDNEEMDTSQPTAKSKPKEYVL